MKLIIFYGPPGVGKLTVAKILAKKTGYKLFHNHLTLDLIESLFERGHKAFSQLIDRYRLDLIKIAAKYRLDGVIMTFVYCRWHDESFFQQIIDVVEKYKGRVLFVQLKCGKKELKIRLVNPSRRRKFRKLTDIEKFNKFIKLHDVFSSVPFEPNLTIDTTNIKPSESAKITQSYYRLDSK